MTDKLTDHQYAVLTSYVAKAQVLLKLTHWDIVVMKRSTDNSDGNLAASWLHDQYGKCDIEFYQEFFTMDATRQTLAVIHELGHCHFQELSVLANAVDLLHLVPKVMLGSRDFLVKSALERAMDHYSLVLLPLVERELGLVDLTEADAANTVTDKQDSAISTHHTGVTLPMYRANVCQDKCAKPDDDCLVKGCSVGGMGPTTNIRINDD